MKRLKLLWPLWTLCVKPIRAKYSAKSPNLNRNLSNRSALMAIWARCIKSNKWSWKRFGKKFYHFLKNILRNVWKVLV
uniref:Putative secreted protein n=1 Tax=Xenopsylla cheopis TaxID=163159 RepID=A0A6M2DZC3_XENCH